MRRLGIIIFLFLYQAQLHGQSKIYTDGITKLTLYQDSTFLLESPDPVFPFSHDFYSIQGRYVQADKGIILNAHLEEREPSVKAKFIRSENVDSITFRINYRVFVFSNESDSMRQKIPLELATIYVNGKPYNLVKDTIHQRCLWAPKIRNQMVTGDDNRISIKREKMKKLRFMAYGLEKPVDLPIPADEYSEVIIDYFLPIDAERHPRSRFVRIKGNNAYYYQINGRNSSFLTPLRATK